MGSEMCIRDRFMLMQCGLGLHALALLHLVAHSLYKAHAFLAAGGAVEQSRLRQMAPPAPLPSAVDGALGVVTGMAVVAAAALAWGLNPAAEPALWAVSGILALALVPLVTGPLVWTGAPGGLIGLAVSIAVALGYFGLHSLFGRWLGASSGGSASPILAGWVLGCFGLLFLVQGAVRMWPSGTLARWLYPTLFAGLYLDELFTRLTFRVWPTRVPTMPGALARHSVRQPDVPARS